MDDLRFDVLLAGAAAVLLAVVAWLADRRRMRRSDPDAVGVMPWTALSFWGMFAALLLMVVAAKMWQGG